MTPSEELKKLLEEKKRREAAKTKAPRAAAPKADLPVVRVDPNEDADPDAEDTLAKQFSGRMGRAVDKLQAMGVQTLGAIADPTYLRNFRVPGLDVDVDLTALNPGARFIADNPAARLIAARAYQSVNPFVAGDVGNEALESNPEFQAGANQLTDAAGEYPAAAIQLASQIAPQVIGQAGLSKLIGRGVAAAAPVAVPGIREAVTAAAGGFAGNAYENAIQEVLGARSGQRVEAGVQSLGDPMSLLLAGLGGAQSGLEVMGQMPKPQVVDLSTGAPTPPPQSIPATPVAQILQSYGLTPSGVAREADPVRSRLGLAPADMATQLAEAEQLAGNHRTMVMGGDMADPVRSPLGLDPESVAIQVLENQRLRENSPTMQAPTPGSREAMLAALPPLDGEALPSFDQDSATRVMDSNDLPNPSSARQRQRWDTGQFDMGEVFDRTRPMSIPDLAKMLGEDPQVTVRKGGGGSALSDKMRTSLKLEPLGKPWRAMRLMDDMDLDSEQVQATYHEYRFTDPRSGKDFDILFVDGMRPGELEIDSVKRSGYAGDYDDAAKEDANTFGPRAMMMLLNDIKQKFPDATHLTGFRVTGTRAGKGYADATTKVPLNRSNDVTIKFDFRKAAMEEAGPTQPMAVPFDLAKIMGEDPYVLARRGGGGSGMDGYGDGPTIKVKLPFDQADTQVMWSRDRRRSQDAQAGQAGSTPRGRTGDQTRPMGEAEHQAARERQYRQDPRTVEPPATEAPPQRIDPRVGSPALTGEQIKLVKANFGKPSLWKRFQERFHLPEFRSPEMVAAGIRSFKAATHIANTGTARVHVRLREAYKKAGPDGQKIIDRYIHQNLSPEDIHSGLRVPVEALPPEFRELFSRGMAQVERYRDTLVKAGYFNADQINHMKFQQHNGLVWLHRDYRAYLDKNYKPKDSHIQSAVDWVVRNAKEPITSEQAIQTINAFVQGDGLPERRLKALPVNPQALKSRTGIPKVLRDLLGEARDPAYVTASTMGEIERLHFQHKATEAMVAPDLKGVTWDDKKAANMYHTPVWDDRFGPLNDPDAMYENRKRFGMLAGKYVHPQLHEAIMDAGSGRIKSINDGVLASIVSVFKTAKVALSPVTYTRNWMSNSASAAAAGLPIWSPRWAPRLKQSAEAMIEYHSAFNTLRSKDAPKKGAGAWMQWALEDGAIIPGTGAEFGGSQARVIAQTYLKDHGSGVASYFSKTFQAFNRSKAKLGSFYDSLDTHWRLAVYIEQVTKGRERMGLSMDKARARASRIVSENFASSGTTGPAIRDMSEKAGLFAPFLTWHADNLRVHTNWLYGSRKLLSQPGTVAKDILSGEGGAQALNVALHYGMFAGLFAGARWIAGMSDEEVEKGEEKLRGYQQANMGWREWLPYRDERGRLQVVDLSAIMPSAVFRKGDPNAPFLQRMLMNMGMGFVQGGAIEEPVRQLAAKAGLGEQEYKVPLLPGQEGWRSVLDTAYEYMKPGLVRDFENLKRRTDATDTTRRFEEKLTPRQAAMRFPFSPTAAFAAEPIGEKAMYGKVAETNAKFQKDLNERFRFRKPESGAVSKAAEIVTGKDEKTRLRQEYLRLMAEKKRRATSKK